jgi:hypothetical protein
MGNLSSWLRSLTTHWTVLPLDHYAALDVAQNATEAEIHAAFESMQSRVTSSVWTRVIGFVCGRSLPRLRRARDELCDARERRGYDQYLDRMRAMYRYPPQG